MTIAKVLDKKKMTTTGENNGRYHVKIRITRTVEKQTIQKYFCTGIYATEEEFKRIIGNPGKDKELQVKQSKLNALHEKAKEIVALNPFVDFETFENQLTSKGGFKDPLGLFQSYIDELDEAGRIGSRDSYKQALSCFQEYADQKHNGKLSFAMITGPWLMRWERWMLERGRSVTTVRIYAISLRRVFNLAIQRWKYITSDIYPFGEDKYVIPSSPGRKLALTEDQKNSLLKFATLNITARKGVDFWIFSYFCNGMNMADVCHLRSQDLPDGLVIFNRTKTIFTQRRKKPVVVISRKEIQEIIERWGNKSAAPSSYVFPVLREGLNPAQVKDRIHDFINEVNEGLAIACEALKLPKITSYSARHTYATIIRNKGASVEFIQEALGHSDTKTTQSYLDSFDLDTKRKYSNML
jgi:integrase/recombinase XerD